MTKAIISKIVAKATKAHESLYIVEYTSSQPNYNLKQNFRKGESQRYNLPSKHSIIQNPSTWFLMHSQRCLERSLNMVSYLVLISTLSSVYLKPTTDMHLFRLLIAIL